MTICRGESKEECRKKILPCGRSVLASAEFLQTYVGLNVATKCLSCDTVFAFRVQHRFQVTHQLLHVTSLVISCSVIYSIFRDIRYVDSLVDISTIVLSLVNVFKGFFKLMFPCITIQC